MMPQDFTRAPSPPPAHEDGSPGATVGPETRGDALAVLAEQLRGLRHDCEAVEAHERDLTGRLAALEEDVRALAHVRGARHAQPRAHGRVHRRGHCG